MGVVSMRIITLMGSFMIASFLLGAHILLFLITWPFTKKFKLVARFHTLTRSKLFFNGIIRLVIESYSDLCIAV
jgi:hypothetical protein